jgi:hypothetical protein
VQENQEGLKLSRKLEFLAYAGDVNALRKNVALEKLL